jgi:hypothetical protein
MNAREKLLLRGKSEIQTLFEESQRYFSSKLPCSLGAPNRAKMPFANLPPCLVAGPWPPPPPPPKDRGRRPPGWAARPNAVPTRRSELLPFPSETREAEVPMRPARPSQGRTRSRTRFLSEGLASGIRSRSPPFLHWPVMAENLKMMRSQAPFFVRFV